MPNVSYYIIIIIIKKNCTYSKEKKYLKIWNVENLLLEIRLTKEKKSLFRVNSPFCT